MERELTDELLDEIADKYIRIQNMTFEQYLSLELSNNWHLLEGRNNSYGKEEEKEDNRRND